ncbi:MAG: M20 family metallo-hydrolase [Saprospiraceae bacterium]
MLSTPAQQATDLLRQLIAIPSLSREEDKTADCLEEYFRSRNLAPRRTGNNVWLKARNWRDDGRPTVLLNSHHDTVKAAAGYTRDPHAPDIQGDTLYGLGSNDAGGPLVSLIAAFLVLENDPALHCNLLLAATAEEEISGPEGIAALLPELPPIDCAIVGEPTSLNLAVAERGLIVIDGETTGVSGHAARNEGTNALYLALEDIDRLRNYRFARLSELLGPVGVTVTQIQAGSQHNVVPDRCRFVIDARVNECYTNQEVVDLLQGEMRHARLQPRSLRLNSSGIPAHHPLVRAGLALGRPTYGSPTLSDQALMPFPTRKLGPGDSARSHTADEYILLSEVEAGIELYIKLIRQAYGTN